MADSNNKQGEFPEQPQSPPGLTDKMEPVPDHGEESYAGSGKLVGKVALITGADSGIGRAVAIAFAREGADIVLSYLNEHEDARSTAIRSRQWCPHWRP
jgi:short subunit dehydrogenase